MGGGRNTGIQNATGKYITFVDSDDYLLDLSCYENLINIIEEKKADVLVFNYKFIYQDKEIKNSFSKKIYGFGDKNKENNKYNPSMWNKIFIREKLVKSKILCPEQLAFEDLDFWFRYYISQEPTVYLINDIYYGYRQRANSIMHTLYKKKDYTIIFDRMYEALSKESEDKQKRYRNLYLKYFSDITFIYDYLSNLDDKEKYKEVTESLCELIKKINLSHEEIKTYLGIDFYRLLFTDKYTAELFVKNVSEIRNKKYIFVKENLLLYKIKREILRLLGLLK